MCIYEIIFYPCYQMIFECSFDYLMKKVRRDELINICMGKIFHEQLQERISDIVIDCVKQSSMMSKHVLDSRNNWDKKRL